MTNRKASAVTAIAREQGNRTAAASPTRAIYSGIERKISASRLKWRKKNEAEKTKRTAGKWSNTKQENDARCRYNKGAACLSTRPSPFPPPGEGSARTGAVHSTSLAPSSHTHTHATRQAAGASSTFAILFCYLL